MWEISWARKWKPVLRARMVLPHYRAEPVYTVGQAGPLASQHFYGSFIGKGCLPCFHHFVPVDGRCSKGNDFPEKSFFFCKKLLSLVRLQWQRMKKEVWRMTCVAENLAASQSDKIYWLCLQTLFWIEINKSHGLKPNIKAEFCSHEKLTKLKCKNQSAALPCLCWLTVSSKGSPERGFTDII